MKQIVRIWANMANIHKKGNAGNALEKAEVLDKGIEAVSRTQTVLKEI